MLYGFYNAPLIETASSVDELSPGFVDDSMMLAIGDTLADCHAKLKDMMERPKGGFNWSITHNSPFELSKITLMNFPRLHRDAPPGNLTLDKVNPDGSVITSSISAVTSYKYLGVIFDPGLRLAPATYQGARLSRLLVIAYLVPLEGDYGIKPNEASQLYTMVSVPGFTYGAEVWYTPIFKPMGISINKGLSGDH